MNLKKVLVMCGIGAMSMGVAIPAASAEYVTVQETDLREAFVLDTTSIYQKDEDHINCIVWYEWNDHVTGKVGRTSMLYKFEFSDKKGWRTWRPDDEKHPEKSGKWEELKDGHVPKMVLKSCLLAIKSK